VLEDAGPTSFLRAPGLALVLICLALAATGVFEARLVTTVHGTSTPWSVMFLTTAPRWLFLAAVLPLILRLGWRHPIAPPSVRTAALHGLVFLLVSAGHAVVHAWSIGLDAPFVFTLFSWRARITRSWLDTMPTLVFLSGGVLMTAWGLLQAREQQRRP
jgi:hypothetical protein